MQTGWYALLFGVVLLCCVGIPGRGEAAEALTLARALALATQSDHPDLLRAEAQVAGAEAGMALSEADDDAELKLIGGLKAVDPPKAASDQDSNDSYLKLDLSKRLHDFGRSEASARTAAADIDGGRFRLLDARQQLRLQVMRRFFEVLLADLRHARDNEAMAVAYVGLDKARDRVELKQMAETDLLKLEDEYQQVRRRLTATTNAQRAARAALAIAMNRPKDLPAELVRPKLTALQRKAAELDVLIGEALSRNPRLLALRAEVRREQGRVAEAAASDQPLLSGRLGAAAYHREMGGYNPLEAELTLEVPLYNGGRVDAKAAKARSGVMMKSAELQSAELDVQRRITDLWLELQELKVAHEGLTTRAKYREMNLDRSRALYELEVNTDLGDSMVAISQQKVDEAELGFRAELVWAEMDALTGRLVEKQ